VSTTLGASVSATVFAATTAILHDATDRWNRRRRDHERRRQQFRGIQPDDERDHQRQYQDFGIPQHRVALSRDPSIRLSRTRATADVHLAAVRDVRYNSKVPLPHTRFI
jgi:hypothetical protein